MEGVSSGDDLLPGTLCIKGGIYQVIHREHRETHTVLAQAGDMFPPCTRCGEAVRFRLARQINEPASMRAKKRARKKSAGKS